jgi:hypothetical protein
MKNLKREQVAHFDSAEPGQFLDYHRMFLVAVNDVLYIYFPCAARDILAFPIV